MTKRTDVSKKGILIFLLLSLIGLALRLWGIKFESGDWYESLSVWVAELDRGGLRALSGYSGNYNMPYVTLLLFLTYLPIPPLISIKCLSILFDYIGAFTGGKLVVLCYGETQLAKGNTAKEKIFLLAYGGILLAPTVIVNSSWWAQSDSIYVSFILLALFYMLREKTVRSMIFWGIALAFKLQAILAVPILLLYYWKNRKFSFVYFLLIPLTMEILCLPSIIGGCSPLVTLTTYLGQIGENHAMCYYYSNLWTFFNWAPYWIFGRMAVVGTSAVLLLTAVLILYRETHFDRSNILPYFVWITMTALCFLPNMHERYGYMMELGTILCAALDHRKWWRAIVLQGTTMILYAPVYLRRYLEYDPRIWAAIWLAVYLAVSFEMISVLMKAKENASTLSEREGERYHV